MQGNAQPADTDIARCLSQAKTEWEAARILFDTVTDPDMVDAAIHMVAAAEKKYSYLLRLAKSEGVQVAPPEVAGELH